MVWTAENIPDMSGKTIVITGANSGLGLESTFALAKKGAHVVMACRNVTKGEAAKEQVLEQVSGAQLSLHPLDLSDLSAIRHSANELLKTYHQIHVLMNNAGVMAIPRRETKDGFEMQIGTNHFGHFALTGLLFERLATTPGSRIVNISSNAHKMGHMNFDDLDGRQKYNEWDAYNQSKLSNLLFTYELDRRVRAKAHDVKVVAAHPGWSATNLQYVGAEMGGSKFLGFLMHMGNQFIAQSQARGALPQLYAASSPQVESGAYYGPNGIGEVRGFPKKTKSNARSYNQEHQVRLWEESVRRTDVGFEMLN